MSRRPQNVIESCIDKKLSGSDTIIQMLFDNTLIIVNNVSFKTRNKY